MSIWFVDVEEEHKQIHFSINEWYRKAKKISQEFDYCLWTLMLQILLLNTDGLNNCQLKNKSQIEKSQQKYAGLLYQYLKLNHPENYSSLLSKALMITHDAQRAYELSLKRLQLF